MSQEKLVHSTPNPAYVLYDAWSAMLKTFNPNWRFSGEGRDKHELDHFVSGNNYYSSFKSYVRGMNVSSSRGLNIGGWTDDGPIFTFGYANSGRVRWPEFALAPKGKFLIRSWRNWGTMNALHDWTFFGTTWVYRNRVMYVHQNLEDVNEGHASLNFRHWEERRLYFSPKSAPDDTWWELKLHDSKWVAVPSLEGNRPHKDIKWLNKFRAINTEGYLYGDAIRRYDRIRKKELRALGLSPDGHELNEETIAQVSQVVDIYAPANKRDVTLRPKEAQHG